MNRRQAKKQIKKEYGIVVPKGIPPRKIKRILKGFHVIPPIFEEVNKAICGLTETLGKFLDAVTEIVRERDEGVE